MSHGASEICKLCNAKLSCCLTLGQVLYDRFNTLSALSHIKAASCKHLKSGDCLQFHTRGLHGRVAQFCKVDASTRLPIATSTAGYICA